MRNPTPSPELPLYSPSGLLTPRLFCYEHFTPLAAGSSFKFLDLIILPSWSNNAVVRHCFLDKAYLLAL